MFCPFFCLSSLNSSLLLHSESAKFPPIALFSFLPGPLSPKPPPCRPSLLSVRLFSYLNKVSQLKHRCLQKPTTPTLTVSLGFMFILFPCFTSPVHCTYGRVSKTYMYTLKTDNKYSCILHWSIPVSQSTSGRHLFFSATSTPSHVINSCLDICGNYFFACLSKLSAYLCISKMYCLFKIESEA